MDEIRKEIEKFNGLLDRETAYLLVMEKKGKLKRKKIKDLKKGKASLIAKIESIGRKRENFINMVIGDETGHCILKLWDYLTNIAKYLKEGDIIRIANGWIKKGVYGTEINVGKYGIIEKLNGRIETKLEFGIKEGIFNLKGVLRKKYPTNVYFQNKEKFVAKIFLDEHEILLFDERARDIQKFKEGDEVVLFWLYKGNKIYATDFSRIKEP